MKKGKTMKMSTLCVTILAAAVYCGAFAALGDSLGNIGDVRLKGRLGERLDAMIEKHVAARDVDYITAPFMEKTETKGWWQTEFWGKWMHSAVAYLRYATAECIHFPQNSVCHQPLVSVFSMNGAVM